MARFGVQGTEYVDALDELEDAEELRAERKRKKQQGLKNVGPTYCEADKPVVVGLRTSASEALSRAAYYIQTLPQRVAEVEAAAEAVYEAGRRADK
jgi:hypothetical protein